jgi:uncharacterized membrane protein YhiD involved in acid resistance
MNSFEYFITGFPSIALKLFSAALAGGVLGFERTRKMRGAGLRTYTLVCLGGDGDDDGRVCYADNR